MKKLIFFALALISFNLNAQMCEGRYQEEVFDSVIVNTVDFGLASNQTLQMDIYTPHGDSAVERPVIIFCFGGSFVGGSRTSGELVAFATSFAKRGYVCASIDYRLASSALDLLQEEKMVKVVFGAVQDGKAAIRYFRQDARNGNALGIDSNQVFIGGTSAGGILAINLAYVDDVTKLSSTWQTWASEIGGIEGNSGNPGYCSAPNGVFSFAGAVGDTSYIEANDVPFYSCHATGDQTVLYGYGPPINGLAPVDLYGSGNLETRLTNLGVYNQVDTYSGSDHPPLNGNDFDTTLAHLTTFFYNILDCNPNNYKKSDQQGCETFSIEPGDTTNTSIFGIAMAKDLKVYPNPAREYLVIESENDFTEIVIVDVLGREVYYETLNAQNEKLISIKDFSEGMYALKIKVNQTWQSTTILIK